MVRFAHHALSEVSFDEIDTSATFLDHTVSLPFIISPMTGGSEDGCQFNRELAAVAQRFRIPIGTGSMRVLFRHPEVYKHFAIKDIAPDVPVLANIGAIEVRDRSPREIDEWLRKLSVQAVTIHLNAGQELFQSNGDRDYRGAIDAIKKFCSYSSVPVIVKETGFGFLTSEVDKLLEAGARYVDIAGSGGTNWILVEGYREQSNEEEIARQFSDWGNPTAAILTALRNNANSAYKDHIIASGGIRGAMDIAKAIALGASMTAAALPVLKAHNSGGIEGVASMITGMATTLRRVLMLTGCSTLDDLRQARLFIDPLLRALAESL